MILRRLESLALAGDAVHDDRLPELAGLLQQIRQGSDVVPVDGAGVLDAEVGEQAVLGRQHVLDPGLEAVHQVVERAPDEGHRLHRAFDEAERLRVARVGAQHG